MPLALSDADARAPLLVLLNHYQAAAPEAGPTVQLFREFALTHADCLERTCVLGHLTGSAWLVDGDGRRVLLILGGEPAVDGVPGIGRVLRAKAVAHLGAYVRLELMEALDGRELFRFPRLGRPKAMDILEFLEEQDRVFDAVNAEFQ